MFKPLSLTLRLEAIFAECKESQIDIVCRICLMWMNLEIISSIEWASGQTRHKTRPWVTLNWNRCRLPSLASQELLWGPSNKLGLTSKLCSSSHHNILRGIKKPRVSVLIKVLGPPLAPSVVTSVGLVTVEPLTMAWPRAGSLPAPTMDDMWHVTRWRDNGVRIITTFASTAGPGNKIGRIKGNYASMMKTRWILWIFQFSTGPVWSPLHQKTW